MIKAKALDIYVPLCFSCLVQWQSLVEFTVISKTEIDNTHEDFGWAEDLYYQVHLLIDNVVLRVHNEWPVINDEVIAIIHKSELLEVGQQYLTFINTHMLDGRVIAKINYDRTLIPIMDAGGYLQDHRGYTVEQFRDVVAEMLQADIHNYSEIDWGNIHDFEGTTIHVDDIIWDDLVLDYEVIDNIEILDGMIIGNAYDSNSIIISQELLIGIVVTLLCVNGVIIFIIYSLLKRHFTNRSK
jgi:hypothetical protein